jgi:hypothetical protein
MFLPPLPAGQHEIAIDFTVDRRRMEQLQPYRDDIDEDTAAMADPDDQWERVGSYSVTLRTAVSGRVEDQMTARSSAALDAIMQQVFGNAVRWTGGGLSPVRFGINAPATFTAEFDQTAIGVSVQLERDGAVARRLNLWWIGGWKTSDGERHYGFEINLENLDLLRQLQDEDGWVMRVRGDPLIALRAGVASHYWQGEFTMPINLRTSETHAPPRMWWVEGENDQRHAPDAEIP